MDNYEEMGTSELRKLIRERGIGKGLALSGANKETCVKLLRGEMTWAEFEAGNGASFSSACAGTEKHSDAGEAGNAGKDAMAQIAAGLAALMPKAALDESRVREIAAEVVKPYSDSMAKGLRDLMDSIKPVRVVVERPETGETKDMGVVHNRFPVLLKMCQARDKDGFVPPIYLYGPAGTGKTTTARKVAEALGLPFYYNGAIGNAYELSGFIDAGGRYNETPFYKAYSGGGVYLFDELDSSMPGAVLAFNAALANGHAAFPVGNVARHKDCVILAAGNTCMRGDGNGAGFQRMKQDAAFRDRFTYLEWPIDLALESAMADSYGDEWGWLDRVRRYRRNAERAGIKDFEVTPRAVDRGLTMLRAGVELNDVIESCVRKGLSKELWNKVEGV